MQCPSLQEIYDLSTNDLYKLEEVLQRNPHDNQDLLEATTLEIQQRKTLQYFTELCQVENPYTKKVADFNSQFLKLANQALAKNQSVTHTPSNILEKQLLQTPPIIQVNNTYSDQVLEKHKSHQETESDTKSMQSEYIGRGDDISITSMKSTSKDSRRTDNNSQVSQTKKMNLGLKKGKKGKIKEIMQNTLARTKVDEDVVLKRSSASPSTNLANQKKFHIPGEKHEKIQIHNKPPTSQHNIEKQSSANRKVQTQKNIKNQAEAAVQRKKAIERMKEEQPKNSFKLPKINQKDLLKMVKDQEAKKKAKTEKIIRQSMETLPNLEIKKNENENQIVQEIQKEEGNDQNIKIFNEDVIQEVIKEEQLQQSLSPNKLDKILLQKEIPTNRERNVPEFNNNYVEKQNSKSETKIPQQQKKVTQQQNLKQKNKDSQVTLKVTQKEIERITNGKQEKIHKKEDLQEENNNRIQERKSEESNKKQRQRQIKEDKQEINEKNGFNNNKNETNEEVNYMKKLLEEIETEQEKHQLLVQKIKINQQPQQQQQKQKQEPLVQEYQIISKQKKCYSQEYWAHIREEAELKIKRFRQEKEIIQHHDFAYVEQQHKEQSNQHSHQKQQQQTQQQNSEIMEAKDLDEKEIYQEEAEIKKKEEELNKIKKQLMKKTNQQKKSQDKAIPPPPKMIRPKPEFDYFSVYPTFNHIFSVTYLKSAMQANAEIPNIMRDIKTLFTTHTEHFSNRKTFQPAIFLPFDSTGTFKLTDPKQLLLHAQNTYVDLKVLIQRVQMFNKNLQGQFNDDSQSRYYRVVKSKEEVYDIITTSFLRRKGWKELPHGCSLRSSWNLFWSWSKPDIDLGKLLVWQRINHFPFNKNLSRKDLLYKNLEHFRKVYKVPMNFLPLTFTLPKEFTQLSVKFHEEEMLNRQHNYWIMKPIGKSRGRGIKVISALSELNYVDNIVVQKYISNPMLLDGYKFDMRIYVLVTSFHPLEAFVYRQGFARLSTQKYKLDPNSIKNTFIHLTNFSVNKNNVEGKTNFLSGSKISMKTLKDKLTRMGYSFSDIWAQVHDIIIKSLLGCSVSVPSFPTAFELFGYDIMADDQGNCHIIEINSSPSLERSYMLDEIVKQNLIDDIFDIVDPPNFDKKQMLDVFSERITQMSGGKKISTEDDLIGLARILKYQPVRKVGEMPQKMGLFERVAPCAASLEIQRLIKAKSGANNPQNID